MLHFFFQKSEFHWCFLWGNILNVSKKTTSSLTFALIFVYIPAFCSMWLKLHFTHSPVTCQRCYLLLQHWPNGVCHTRGPNRLTSRQAPESLTVTCVPARSRSAPWLLPRRRRVLTSWVLSARVERLLTPSLLGSVSGSFNSAPAPRFCPFSPDSGRLPLQSLADCDSTELLTVGQLCSHDAVVFQDL